MRKIGEVDNRTDASIFSNYLVSLGIRNEIEENAAKHWIVWVESDEHLASAEEELEQFLSDPQAHKYSAKAREGKALLEQEKKEATRARSRIIDARTNLASGVPPAIGFVTIVLIGISAVVFILMNYEPTSGVRRMLQIASTRQLPNGLYTWYTGLQDVLHGQVWRLITPIFLHFSILHILFNMLWLKQLGSEIEYLDGSRNLIAQVLVYGIVGNVAQYYMSGPFFGGMSGVVYGLFRYVWICSIHDPQRPFYLDKANTIMIIAWYFACLFGLVGDIANTAHTVGLVGGILWATFAIRQIPFTKIRF